MTLRQRCCRPVWRQLTKAAVATYSSLCGTDLGKGLCSAIKTTIETYVRSGTEVVTMCSQTTLLQAGASNFDRAPHQVGKSKVVYDSVRLLLKPRYDHMR